MVKIESVTMLENFREFLILSCCKSFMPPGYFKDQYIFPERDSSLGTIYIEAASKIELSKIRDITFTRVYDVLGVIYVSRSGNTNLKWRQSRGRMGKVSGEASSNSLVNLIDSRVLTRSYIEDRIRREKVQT